MFEEKEGRDGNWTCITIMAVFMTICNLIIVVGVRTLLDSEDEISEPYVQGELRDRLTIFLYIFTMTFFFGCWCCCCCGCVACRYLPKCPSATGSLVTNIAHKFISSHPSIRRKLSVGESEVEIEEIVVGSYRVQQPPLKPQKSDLFAYEHEVSTRDEMIQAEASPHVILPPKKQALGRMRSNSIDVSFK